MLVLLVLILLVLVAQLRGRVHRLTERLERLEARLGADGPAARLQADGREAGPPAAIAAAASALPLPVEPAAANRTAGGGASPGDAGPASAEADEERSRRAERMAAPVAGGEAPSAALATWRRLERLLIENWTGILGVVIVVAGVTFLVVNLALRLGPLARFLLTLAAAGALMVPHGIWGRAPLWRRLTLWMRSGGAALVLFACVAGGGLPALGLRWITDPGAALALLLAGMAVNLAVAASTRVQGVATLHVLVNLVPLLLVPQNRTTLAIASLVALAGLLRPRRAWDRHRLLVSAGYSLFLVGWVARAGALAGGAAPELRSGAALGAVLVFGAGLLSLHRHRWPGRSRQTLRLATLILLWGGIGLALAVLPLTAASRAIALVLAASLALLLGRRAGAASNPSLRLADTVIAQALVMAALLSLRPLVADALLLTLALLVEAVLFLELGAAELEPLLLLLGWGLVVVLSLALLVQGLEAAAQGLALRNAGMLIGGSALLAAVGRKLQRRKVPQPAPQALGWLAGALVLVGSCLAPPPAWQAPLALVSIGGLLIAARRFGSPGLWQGACTAVVGAHGVGWVILLREASSPGPALRWLLPLLGLALLCRGLARRRLDRPLGLDLAGIDLGLAAWVLLAPLSPLIPGVAWLLLSLLALEGADRLRRPEAGHALALGVGFLGAFALNYLLITSQSPAWVELAGVSLRSRLLIELFALAVLLSWWFFRPRRLWRPGGLWSRLHPWFLELSLLAGVVTILSEVSALWRPPAWALLALLLLSPALRRGFAARIQLYSVLLYWLAGAAVLAMLSTGETPSPRWIEQPHPIGLLSIVLLVLYILASRRWLRPDDLRQPGGPPLLAALGRRVAHHPHRWLHYPLFLVVALYLASRYDHAVLTLLWALEAFVIYVLSVVLRDNQFRVVALLAMGACLLRLVAIDMAQADLGLRGLVFVGVGLLMLAMNAIYSRFRERFR